MRVIKLWVKLLFAKKLKEYLIRMIIEAEKRGLTAGIDLPEEKIAEYIAAVILGNDIPARRRGDAVRATELLKKMIYKDNVEPL